MMKTIMMAIALAAALVTTNAQAQKQAPYIGQTIQFYAYDDPIGCRNPRMALQVSRLKKWERRMFANELRLLGDRDTTCVLLRESKDDEWRIAEIGRNKTDRGGYWLCLESTIDLRSEEEADPKSSSFIQPHCFWANVERPPPSPDVNKTLRDYNEWRRQQDARK